MTFNPINFAEKLKKDISIDYIGKNPKIYKSLINNLVSSSGDMYQEKLDDFIRFKGPYIQALSIPKWGTESWETFATSVKIYQEIIDVFSELGFVKLFSYQEEAVKAIIDEIKELLVVASTGRGKTESWLIPILQYILGVKRGDIPGEKKSVKAILIYPTKALSQDQFKRIISILIKLNPRLPLNERITIGIYDGDTPRNGEKKTDTYIHTTFKYFDCPIYNEELEKCRNCTPRHLINDKKGSRHVIKVPNDTCEDELNIDFIYLTRKDIVENKVDILLTNPDTINYRLFNINADVERELFIIKPKFIVLDEIHIYSGIFGAFTSMLLKRYRAVRKKIIGDDDDLRIIAASATVQNKRELFSKISGSLNPRIIEEEIIELTESLNPIENEIPNILKTTYLSNSNLIDLAINNNLANFANNTNISKFSETSDEEKIEILQNYLYNYFVNEDTDELYHSLIRLLYSILILGSKTVDELKDDLKNRITDTFIDFEFETFFYNLYFIACFSGIIENRIHLFSWPLDGFYGCTRCGKIYANKVDICDYCKNEFITSIVLCSFCGEKFFESWYCPECHYVYPANINNEGLSTYFEKEYCEGAGIHDPGIECLKVIWKPTIRCNKCGLHFEKNSMPRCKNSNCNDNLLEFIPNRGLFFCNSCSEFYNLDTVSSFLKKCPTCESSDLQVLNIEGEDHNLHCLSCGHSIRSDDIRGRDYNCPEPECGGRITPYRHIPWVCFSCGNKSFTRDPPSNCSECNARIFILNGLFEITKEYECRTCDKDFVVQEACGKAEHLQQISPVGRAYDSYKVILKDYTVGDFNKRFRMALYDGKCYHEYKKNLIGKRFDKLFYTPVHTAVTSAAFLLRYFLKLNGAVDSELFEKQLKEAKALSFADTISEMEEMTINFREPEYELFIDQTVYLTLKEHPECMLNNLQQLVYEKLRSYFKAVFKISDDRRPEEERKITERINLEFSNLLKVKKQKVNDRIFGSITDRFISFYHFRNFVEQGIADIKFEEFDILSNEEKKILKEVLFAFRNVRWLDKFAGVTNLGSQLKRNRNKLENLGDSEEDEAKRDQIKAKINDLTIDIDNKREATNRILQSLIEKNYVHEEYGKYYIKPDKISCYIVGPERPIKYNPKTNEFLTKYHSLDPACINFEIPPEERKDINNALYFSRNIYRILNFTPPLYLRSITYKGDTDKFTRREIEFKFKNSSEINFLSTGPAMEIGIDIGDLNLLILYGTPPNINSYLQRIGRSGRKAKRSLILSISKRNPIDYYYFNNTLKLIDSEIQPVPLNTVNTEIIRISLTWAILDYISMHYNIDWVEHDEKFRLKELIPKENIQSFPKNDYKRFTQIIGKTISKLLISSDDIDAFEVLYEIISRDSTEILAYLKSILDFKMCRQCGVKYPRDQVIQECSHAECSGQILDMRDYFESRNLFQDVIDNFKVRMYKYCIDFLKELEDKEDEIRDKFQEIRRKERAGEGVKEELLKQKNELRKASDLLTQLFKELNNMDFSVFMRNSAMKKYFFNIRNIDDEIEIFRLYSDGGEMKKGLAGTRNLSLALREYHPYAKVLSHSRDYFVTNFKEDILKMNELQSNEEIINYLNIKKYCRHCNIVITSESGECSKCGNSLDIFENIIPKSVDILFRGLPINLGEEQQPRKIFPNDLYPHSSRDGIKVRKTHCSDTKVIYEFEPEKGISVKDQRTNEELFQVKFGEVKIIYFTEKFNVSYDNGIFDRRDRFFAVCAHDNCNSILSLSQQIGLYQCPKDINHTRPKYIRLVRDFHSRGIEIRFRDDNDIRIAHTFAHGLRLALQKIAGVDVRTIAEAESTSTESIFYIFDDILGGNGVCDTLFYIINDEYKNLQEALIIMKNKFGSCCQLGCPHCVYQFGCYVHNNPKSFDKFGLLEILQDLSQLKFDEIDISYE